MSQDNQRQAVLHSYIAGLIDGEGTIRIAADRLKSKPHWNLRYNAHVGIGMTERKALELFSKEFGGNIHTERVLGNRKPMYRWETSGTTRVLSILETLFPYLLVKRRQAELVIRFCKAKQTQGFRRNKGVPEREIQRRKDFYLKVKKLNAVGAAAQK